MFAHYGLHEQYVFRVIQQLKADATNTCSVCADTNNVRHHRRLQCRRNHKCCESFFGVFSFSFSAYEWMSGTENGEREYYNRNTNIFFLFPSRKHGRRECEATKKNRPTADKTHMCHRRNNFINLISCVLFSLHKPHTHTRAPLGKFTRHLFSPSLSR